MALPGNKDFNEYDNYVTDENSTTSAQAQDYFRNQAELLKAVIDCDFWQPETVYQPGDVVKSDSMPNGTEAVMVATKASVTSNIEPQWGDVGGANVSDGACFWHLRYRAVSINNIEADNKGNITIPVMRASTNVASGADGLVPAPPATSNELFLSNGGEWKEAGKVKSVNGKTGAVTLKESPVDMTDYIVESYRNGTEWYEVYKSGKVRQGGVTATNTSENNSYSITLHKPFKDTNYMVFWNGQRTSRTENAWGYTHSYTTTNFKCVSPASTKNAWVAEGQGA